MLMVRNHSKIKESLIQDSWTYTEPKITQIIKACSGIVHEHDNNQIKPILIQSCSYAISRITKLTRDTQKFIHAHNNNETGQTWIQQKRNSSQPYWRDEQEGLAIRGLGPFYQTEKRNLKPKSFYRNLATLSFLESGYFGVSLIAPIMSQSKTRGGDL